MVSSKDRKSHFVRNNAPEEHGSDPLLVLHDYKNKHKNLFGAKEKENKLFEMKYFLVDFKTRI